MNIKSWPRSEICYSTVQFIAANTCLWRLICTEVSLCVHLKNKWLVLHIQIMSKEGSHGGGKWEGETWLWDSDWHVARRHWSVSWRTYLLTMLRVSGPGTVLVSGVGGLLTRVWMCVSRPSGLKPLPNIHPRNDTDTVPSGSPPSPDGVPGKRNLYLFPQISLNLSAILLLALYLCVYLSLAEHNHSH